MVWSGSHENFRVKYAIPTWLDLYTEGFFTAGDMGWFAYPQFRLCAQRESGAIGRFWRPAYVVRVPKCMWMLWKRHYKSRCFVVVCSHTANSGPAQPR